MFNKDVKKTCLWLLALPLVAIPIRAEPLGRYVGLGVTRNKIGHDSYPYAYNRNASTQGVTVQARFPIIEGSSGWSVSVRPLFNLLPTADGSTGAALGMTATLDRSLNASRRTNLYLGAGGLLGLSGGLAQYEAGLRTQVIGIAGIESAVGKNLVIWIDVKLPTSTPAGSAYSPIMGAGIGWKF